MRFPFYQVTPEDLVVGELYRYVGPDDVVEQLGLVANSSKHPPALYLRAEGSSPAQCYWFNIGGEEMPFYPNSIYVWFERVP